MDMHGRHGGMEAWRHGRVRENMDMHGAMAGMRAWGYGKGRENIGVVGVVHGNPGSPALTTSPMHASLVQRSERFSADLFLCQPLAFKRHLST